MGRRGPPPTPTAVKKRRGTYRADRARNEPKPRLLAPPCPRWLDRVAQAEWRRVAPMLERLDLLTEMDGTALALYCDAYSRWRAAKTALAGKLTFKTKTGYIGQRPELAIVNTAFQQIRQACLEFGMTPSSRGRMRLPDKKPKEEDEELEDFLDAGKVVTFRGRKAKG